MAESISYVTALLMLIGGTFASAYVTPVGGLFFDHPEQFTGGLAARGIAALIAFVLVHFRKEVLQAMKRYIGNYAGGQK
jgi:hypothetical protein